MFKLLIVSLFFIASSLIAAPTTPQDIAKNAQFIAAVVRKDTNLLEQLLKQGVSIDTRDDKGQTGLMIAVNTGGPDLVQFFLDHSANVNAQSSFVYHPYSSHYEFLDGYYWGKIPQKIKTASEPMVAVRKSTHNKVEIIDTPLSQIKSYTKPSKKKETFSGEQKTIYSPGGCDGKTCVMYPGTGLDTPLILALHAQQPNAEIIKLLLDHGANPNVAKIDILDNHSIVQTPGWSPLVKAVMLGSSDIINLLLDHGATAKDDALLKAVELGDKASAQILVDHKTDVTKVPMTQQPYLAGVIKNPDVAKLLLDSGVDVNQHDADGNTLLINAAASQSLSALNIILAYKPDVNAQNTSGNSALLRAVDNDNANADIVKALLAQGADVNLKNSKYKTAVDLARDHKLMDIVTMLQAGAQK